MMDSIAAEDARDSAVKGYFKFQVRNAVYLSRLSREYRDEFWNKVYELYPDLKGKTLSYKINEKIISVK